MFAKYLASFIYIKSYLLLYFYANRTKTIIIPIMVDRKIEVQKYLSKDSKSYRYFDRNMDKCR